MNQRIEKIKIHFVENKDRYITGVSCLVVGAIGTLAFTQRVAVSQQAQNIALLNWKPFNFLQQTTIVQLPARGHRGIVVVRDKTGTPYASIHEAADALGISRYNLSQHLRGLQDSVNGETFTNLGENLSEEVKIPK